MFMPREGVEMTGNNPIDSPELLIDRRAFRDDSWLASPI
jgi:hypothetical protein